MDDYRSDEFSLDYLAAVGAVTLNFAALETTLDFMVAMTFNGLDRMGEKEIPRSLDRKLSFLRKAFKHSVLGPIKADADRVFDRVHNVKEERHDAVHGALIGSGLDIVRVRYTPERHVTQIKQALSDKDMEGLALRIRALFEAALSVAIDAGNLVTPERSMDNPFRRPG
jgi:hypothetical protein